VSTLRIHADRRLLRVRMSFAVMGGSDRRLSGDAVSSFDGMTFARLGLGRSGWSCGQWSGSRFVSFGREREVREFAGWRSPFFRFAILKTKKKVFKLKWFKTVDVNKRKLTKRKLWSSRKLRLKVEKICRYQTNLSKPTFRMTSIITSLNRSPQNFAWYSFVLKMQMKLINRFLPEDVASCFRQMKECLFRVMNQNIPLANKKKFILKSLSGDVSLLCSTLSCSPKKLILLTFDIT